MRFGYLGFGSAVLFSLLSTASANAQRVSADIRIGGGGPVSGRVIIGSRPRYDYYRPRVVRVEVVHVRHDRGWHRGWFKHFRQPPQRVIVYYDRGDDCYYDGYGPGLEEIQVYESEGRYYRFDDPYYDRYGCNDDGYGRYDGRYDDDCGYDDRRYDDRRYDDRRYDDRRYDDRRYDDRRYDNRRNDRRRYDDRDRRGSWDGRYDRDNRDGRDEDNR